MAGKIWITYVIGLGLGGLWFVATGLRAGFGVASGRARTILGLGIVLLVAKRFMIEDSLMQELCEAAAPMLMIWGFVLHARIPAPAKATNGAT